MKKKVFGNNHKLTTGIGLTTNNHEKEGTWKKLNS